MNKSYLIKHLNHNVHQSKSKGMLNIEPFLKTYLVNFRNNTPLFSKIS